MAINDFSNNVTTSISFQNLDGLPYQIISLNYYDVRENRHPHRPTRDQARHGQEIRRLPDVRFSGRCICGTQELEDPVGIDDGEVLFQVHLLEGASVCQVCHCREFQCRQS
jgi:hypothetical protein